MSFEKKLNHGEALFHSALAEFIAHGYSAASLNQILSTAGMSKGQFYYHFGNKKGLYFALIDVMQKKKQAFWAQNLDAKELPQDFFERFGKELEMTRRFTQEHPDIQRFSEALLKEVGNPIFEQALEEKNIADDSQIQKLITQGYQEGLFRKDLSLEFIQNILSYLSTHISEMFDLDQSPDFEMHLEPLLKLLHSGMSAEKSDSNISDSKKKKTNVKKKKSPKKEKAHLKPPKEKKTKKKDTKKTKK